MKKNVALIFGGEGYERRISEVSAENLSSLIDEAIYDIFYIGIADDGCWYIYNGARDKIGSGAWSLDNRSLTPTYPVMIEGKSGFLAGSEILAADCAVPCLHGDMGEDGVIQGALRAAHIPYIGQDVYASAVTSDKVYTKALAEHLGIPTARWLLSSDGNAKRAMARAERKIGYPMFLKPSRLGSSYGASPVYAPEDFPPAYENARSYDERIIIEELIPADYELECALLDADGRRFCPRGRVMSGGSFYDFKAKYESSSSTATTVLGGDPEIEKKASYYAERLTDVIGLKALSRIDFFVTRDKKLYFNEINAFPGMTDSSLYPILTQCMGLGRGDFINLLIEKVCSNDRRI